MADKGKLERLGDIDGKEYYLDMRRTEEDDKGIEIANPNYQKVVWRVPDIREAVVSEPGCLILSADYSQIEVKLMAHLSRDPVLIAAINSGKDIHSFNATEVFGHIKHFDYDTLIAAKKKEHPRHTELVKLRNDIKTVTFGVPYGAGARKVALMTGMSEEEAQEFIDAFFSKFKVLGAWLKQSGDFAIKYGYSLSPRGRRRFYDLPAVTASDKERDKIVSQIRRYAGNHPIQSGNVDMLKPAMYQIYNDLHTLGYATQGARILFCVHDEIVLTCKTIDALRRDESGKILSLEELEIAKKAKIVTVPGPIEAIMMKRMKESYDGIIPDIVNKIDVAIGPIWEKA
jgi:DNA polymerase-1